MARKMSSPAAPKILPSGTIVTCPSCNLVLMQLKEDLLQGQVIKSSYFEPINHKPVPNTFMRCPACDTSYAGFKIHTSEGWK